MSFQWYHSVAHPGPGNVDDLFKHARRRQSVINCDFTNSCREYIRFSPAAARQDTRMYASRHPQAAAASKSRANAEKDEL